MVCAVLLTQASRQDMLEMVGITVARLQQAPMQRRHSGPAAPKLLQSPQQDAAARDALAAPARQAAVQNGSSAAAPSADGDETETGMYILHSSRHQRFTKLTLFCYHAAVW